MAIILDDIRAAIAQIPDEALRGSILSGFNNLADMQEKASKQASDSLSRLTEAQATNRALLATVGTSQALPEQSDTLDLDSIKDSFVLRPAIPGEGTIVK